MRAVVAVFVLSVIYSTIRYVAFAPANIEHLPVFIVNKGVSMAAAFCFAIAFFRQLRGKSDPPVWFRAGVMGVVAHIFMSLAILSPAYFPEFFGEKRMSFNGEAVFMFGAFAAAGVYLLTRQNWTASHRWWLSLVTMALLFSHILSMGLARGLNINKSHAYMPPMWLLSLIGVGLGLAFVLMTRQAAIQAKPRGEA